ncbi:MAG: adenosine deaminase, partial [Deltaproteobacteria bacterium]
MEPPDEIWVVTTEGEKTTKSLELLFSWWQLLGGPVPLRVWQATGTNELAGEEECSRIRELTLRACLHAVEKAGRDGQTLLSLAGGRKTMSADLQWAGSIFGCHALLHVVDNGDFPKELRFPAPAFMTGPLPIEINGKACAGVVTPLVVGRGYHSDFLDVDWNDRGPVTAGRFPLPGVDSLLSGGGFQRLSWEVGISDILLVEEIAAREKEGQQLLGNYLAEVSRDEHHENWRSLYRLPPKIIDRLRKTIVVEELKPVLDEIPKAEIHCHLGGILDLQAQVRVGRAVWDSLALSEKKAALKQVDGLLKNSSDWSWEWPETLLCGDRSANTAALLVNLAPETLEKHLYDATRPRFALAKRHKYKFKAYERPGELTGSAILGRPEGIRQYAEEVYRQICRQKLLYCELRGSPVKYLAGDGLEFLHRFHDALEIIAGNEKKTDGRQP